MPVDLRFPPKKTVAGDTHAERLEDLSKLSSLTDESVLSIVVILRLSAIQRLPSRRLAQLVRLRRDELPRPLLTRAGLGDDGGGLHRLGDGVGVDAGLHGQRHAQGSDARLTEAASRPKS